VTIKNDKVYTAIVLQGGGALGPTNTECSRRCMKGDPDSPRSRSPVSRSARSPRPSSAAPRADPMNALDTMWREKFTVSIGVQLHTVLDRSLAAVGDPGMYVVFRRDSNLGR